MNSQEQKNHSLGPALTPEEAGALAHPSRRSIAEALGSSTSGLTVAELAERVRLHPNAVRQHLDVLQRTGVVVSAPSAPTGRRALGWSEGCPPAALAG